MKNESSIRHLFCKELLNYRGSPHPEQGVWDHQGPSLGPALSISASSLHSSEQWMWTSVLYLNLCCASFNKMCAKMSSLLPCQFTKGFKGTLYFQIVEDTCTHTHTHLHAFIRTYTHTYTNNNMHNKKSASLGRIPSCPLTMEREFSKDEMRLH